MPKILILYRSAHGQTAKIAARIGAAIEREGARPSTCLGVLHGLPDRGRRHRGVAHRDARYLDDFVEQTGWTPARATTFAGALQYREYDFATRLLMRLLMRRMHHPTDASRDYDYTDWDAVDRWAHEFAARLGESTVTDGGVLRSASTDTAR